MGSLGEIALPAGTELVDLREVPRLLSWALFPAKEEGSWRTLIGFKKIYFDPVRARPDCIHLPLDGNDWMQLDAIWDSPPPFREPMYDVDWQQYEDVFHNSQNKPSWQIVPCWDETEMDRSRLRKESEVGHVGKLTDALKKDEIELADAVSPVKTNVAQQWKLAKVSVIALERYVSRYGLSVRVMNPSTDEGAATKPVGDYAATSQNGYWSRGSRQSMEVGPHDSKRRTERYTIREAAIELAHNTDSHIDRWLDHVVQSVKAGDLPLRNPRDRNDSLPYRIPKIVRTWYDEVTTTDLNAWLESHPEWGITYRLPALGEPTQLHAASDTATITNAAPTTTVMEWVKHARPEGEKIRQDHPEMSTTKISVHVHEYLTKNKITGRGGRVPSPETIRRHALKDL